MAANYNTDGYTVIKEFLTPGEIKPIKDILQEFHDLWINDNSEFYSSKALNSAYLTGKKYLSDNKRQMLFNLIASSKLAAIYTSLFSIQPMFMNTQLFFNPVNLQQANYWHRDPQYHLSAVQQQEALKGPAVVHFRIPLADEPGLEVVPGTHKRWDTEEELDIRLGDGGKKNHRDLSTGVKVNLDAGDLLVFSANMIHRGLYGMDRFAFDVLLCEPIAELAKFVERDCLPTPEMMNEMDSPSVFINTINLRK